MKDYDLKVFIIKKKTRGKKQTIPKKKKKIKIFFDFFDFIDIFEMIIIIHSTFESYRLIDKLMNSNFEN